MPISLSGLVVFSFVVNPTTSIAAIYGSLLMAVTWFLLYLIADRLMPDYWSSVCRFLPFLGLAASLYGIYQFVALPEWDRRWMVASRLTSIGAPFPEQVRVFGPTESPGVFALLVGISSIVSIILALRERVIINQIGYSLCALFGLIALILSGVRVALLSISVVLVVLAVRWLRGWARLLPLVGIAFGYYCLTVVVSRFGGQSSIFSADRLTGVDASRDDSLLARFELYRRVPSLLTRPLGSGVAINPRTGAEQVLDSTYVDILYRQGPIAFVLVTLLSLLVLKASLRIVPSDSPSIMAAGGCSVFLIVFMFAGNVFASGTGLIAVLIFGSVLLRDADSYRCVGAGNLGSSSVSARPIHPDRHAAGKS
ncbi:hypothetical protein [Rhodococcoides kroppenstedtii]|uniref:hypothetical protein n=1 Tax=Rhodococcoides kroppenstedtii TaxID=293050 RepID=UPI00362EA6C4